MVILSSSSSSGSDKQVWEKYSTCPRTVMAVLPLSDPRSYLWFYLTARSSLSAPKSVWVSSAATKLLSLEEAQAQRRGHSSSAIVTESRDIEVEEGPAALPGKFHKVIGFPSER